MGKLLFVKKESLLYLSLLCLILQSGPILGFGIEKYLYVTCLVSIFCVNPRSDISKRSIFLIVVICSFVFLNCIFSDGIQMYPYLSMVSKFLIVILICQAVRKQGLEFEHYLYAILKIVIIHSMIGFILSNTLFSDLYDGDVISFHMSNGVDFSVRKIAGAFFRLSYITIGEKYFWRNMGIFWEPGVLVVYANIFLFLSLYYKQYRTKMNVILGIGCVFSTISTMGLFVASMIVISFLLNEKLSFWKKLSTSFVLIALLALSADSMSQKMEMFYNQKRTSSYGARMADSLFSMGVAMHYPILGIGLETDVYLKKIQELYIAEKDFYKGLEVRSGNTNGVSAIPCKMGFPFFALYLWGILRQTVIMQNRSIFAGMLLICFLSEPLSFAPFFLLFPISGYYSLKT